MEVTVRVKLTISHKCVNQKWFLHLTPLKVGPGRISKISVYFLKTCASRGKNILSTRIFLVNGLNADHLERSNFPRLMGKETYRTQILRIVLGNRE